VVTDSSARPSRRRPWSRAAGLAALAVYVPQLLPLAATDLLGHAHCLGIYLRFFPVLAGLGPGISARVASDVGEPLEELVLVAVAAVVTATLLAGAALALRRWNRGGLVVAATVAGLSALLSMGAVALIRA
jgi:hypothetical protein